MRIALDEARTALNCSGLLSPLDRKSVAVLESLYDVAEGQAVNT